MDGESLYIAVLSMRDLPMCDRCWNHTEEAGEHTFWPDKVLCPRCVGVLLETKWPPYIKVADGDYELCVDEAEWHRRMTQLGTHPWIATAA